jgi:hypothetical protein
MERPFNGASRAVVAVAIAIRGGAVEGVVMHTDQGNE